MEWIEIRWRSEWYERAMELRDRLLRAPLGLTFDDDDRLAEQHQLHFGLVQNDRLIACVVAVPLGDHRVKLRQMAVEEDRQRSGLGSSLLRQTESELAARGFLIVELNARDIAVGFYAKLGYQVEGESFIEVSIPHFKMTKRLTRR